MCFIIGETKAADKRRKIVYKVLEKIGKRLFGPYYHAVYTVGKTKKIAKLEELHTSMYLDGKQASAGLYVYTTLKEARTVATFLDGIMDNPIAVIVKCDVEPSDLLYVSDDGMQATYRALTLVEIVKKG